MTCVRTLLTGAAIGALLAAPAFAQDAAAEPAPADPRGDLSAGLHDAGQAAWNMRLAHTLEPAPGFFDPEALFDPVTFRETMTARREAEEAAEEAGEEPVDLPPEPRFVPLALANTDLAFQGSRVFVGNYHGFNVYETATDGAPELIASVVCPGGQNDVSVYGDLLFMSVEQNRARLDCGGDAAEGDVNAERFRGIRIFDISDLSNVVQVGAVQTCRGSHTHTLLPDPNDPNRLYVYNSATSSIRPTEELDICSEGEPEDNPDTALYSIDVIEVPLDAPQDARIVNRPRIFADRDTGEIAGLWRGGRSGVATQRTSNTNHCHDITVYPELGLAAGACSGNGILLDISDPANPARISEIFDPDMAYWHSATFNNTGDTVVFTDEWGGGTAARCRAEDPMNWGANLVARIDENRLVGESFFKIPAVQGETENCVAHNGSLVPIPGRDVMVQAWYQGGISVIDFTDPANVYEIAYFDRGPVNDETLLVAGYWSVYWHDGKIYGAEIARGFDVLELLPSEHLSEAELAAANRVIEAENVNVQTQTRIAWEDHPDVARAYLEQLTRDEAIDADLAEDLSRGFERWEERGPSRALSRLADRVSEAGDAAEGRTARRFAELASLLRRAAG
ncbi:MAG: LVIVD repeat-containing protein [Oceanicaulis sp.]